MLQTDENAYQKEIEELISRIEIISQHIITPGVAPEEGEKEPQNEILARALTELDGSAEELSIAGEELRQQQEELISAQQALEEEKLRYQNLFELAPDGYLVTDLVGKILEANQRACELLSLPHHLLIGKFLVSFVAPAHRIIFRKSLARLQQCLVEKGKIVPINCREEWEIQMRAHHGPLIEASLTLAVTLEKGAKGIRWLLRDITSRKQIEGERRDLLSWLISTQEEERRQISLELHDQLGQKIAALTLELNKLEHESAFSAGGKQIFKQIQENVQDLGKEIHAIAFDLRPAALDDLGLSQALSNYLEDWSQRFQIPVDTQIRLLHEDHLSQEAATAIYRVVQEALTNVVKHARASLVSLVLDEQPSRVQAIVEDNGCGFDVNKLMNEAPSARRLGMLGMKERVEQARGEFHVESRPGKGTAIYIRIPLLNDREAG